jgi:hypothetical protein
MPGPVNLIPGSGEGLSPAAQTPQFLKAEYGSQPGTQLCAICGGSIGVRSYVVDSKLACARCAAAGGAKLAGDSHAAFMQSLIFGAGAAILGLVCYSAFTIVTHFYLGYVALAVGWLVGKAMMMGSKGVGGARYQIAAVFLTYAAISLASVPILVARTLQSGEANIDWTSVAGKLVSWGIASPFLELERGVSGAIGLVILFVGLRIAYRMTAAKRTGSAARI